MIFRPLTDHQPEPTSAQLRKTALDSAILLRDCSFRTQLTGAERRACRTVMRKQAIKSQPSRPGRAPVFMVNVVG